MFLYCSLVYSSHMIELEYVSVNVLDEVGGQAVAVMRGMDEKDADGSEVPIRVIVLIRGPFHSTVTDLAKFLGWSTSQPRRTAM